MPSDQLHHDALLATARLELDHAHRAALNLEAGDLRRGLQMSLDALAEAAAMPAAEAGETDMAMLGRVRTMVQAALADLDSGALANLGTQIEDARRELGAA